MRIVCPSCQAAYEVPDKLLSSGSRKVRCARCGADWMAEAEPEPAIEAMEPPPPAEPRALAAPLPEEAEPDLPPPPPVRADLPPEAEAEAEVVTPRAEEKLVPEPAEAPSRRLVLVAGAAWLASLAVLGTAGWAAVAFRAEVMAAWGASKRLYGLLGLG
jgi:predicted Zn finger-like uncharacterized protein